MICSDQVYENFLLRNTSWRVSKARAGFPTSMNSDKRKKNVEDLQNVDCEVGLFILASKYF